MLKTFLFSLKKSKILAKITKDRSTNKFDSATLLTNTLYQATGKAQLGEYQVLKNNLFKLLSNDRATTVLLGSHSRTFDDLDKIIKVLEVSGAGGVSRGHYIPVSSVAFLNTLKFLLAHWDGENFQLDGLDSNNSNLKVANIMAGQF